MKTKRRRIKCIEKVCKWSDYVKTKRYDKNNSDIVVATDNPFSDNGNKNNAE